MFGKSLIIDLYNCDVTLLNCQSIDNYLKSLCELLGMKRCQLDWWCSEPGDDTWGILDRQGNSCAQFIKTSAIVIHALTLTGMCYIDIFTCKEFDIQAAISHTTEWFKSNKYGYTEVERGKWLKGKESKT